MSMWRAERVDDASEHAEEVAALKQQLDAAHEVHRLDIQTQAEMVTKLEQTQAGCTALREALAEYATCQDDGCTCGDGWSHDTARDALAQTCSAPAPAGKSLP